MGPSAAARSVMIKGPTRQGAREGGSVGVGRRGEGSESSGSSGSSEGSKGKVEREGKMESGG